MRWLKVTVLMAFSSALILQGCAAWQNALQKGTGIVEGPTSGWKELEEIREEVKIIKGEKPFEVITIPPQSVKGKPEMEINLEPAQIKPIYDLPDGTYPNLKLTPRYTMTQVEEKIRKTGLRPFVHPEALLAETQGKSGKWFKGWIPPATLLLCEHKQDSNGVETFTPVTIARCGNAIRGVKIVITPAKIVERYRDRDKEMTKVIERYRDTVTVTVTKKILPQPPRVETRVEERINPLDYNYDGGGGNGGGGACGGSGPSR